MGNPFYLIAYFLNFENVNKQISIENPMKYVSNGYWAIEAVAASFISQMAIECGEDFSSHSQNLTQFITIERDREPKNSIQIQMYI